jgi:hypothetical protein
MSTYKYEPSSSFTKEQKKLIEEEDTYRTLFVEDPKNSKLDDPHVMLIDVFSGSKSFVYEKESPEELAVPKVLCQHRKTNMVGSAIVDSKNTFLSNLDLFANNLLAGMNWSNVFLAGGAVLGSLSNDQKEFYQKSDIDLFIYGLNTDDEANKKLKEIYNLVAKNSNQKPLVLRTFRAVTILIPFPYRHVQVILRFYKSPTEVLLGFDIDSCCVGYDGDKVWCMERFRRALTKRYNLVNHSRRSTTYEQRLYKYSKRGFAVAVPNLDKNRIDPNMFHYNRINTSTGLKKLILYDYRECNFPPSNIRRRGKEVEESDYTSINIPWGPELQNQDQIMSALKNKDKIAFFAAIQKRKRNPDNQEKLSYNPVFIGQLDNETWRRVLDGREMKKPLEWIKEKVAYQDLDNNYRRLLTGSFNPVNENWEEGVYGKSENDQINYRLSKNTDDEHSFENISFNPIKRRINNNNVPKPKFLGNTTFNPSTKLAPTFDQPNISNNTNNYMNFSNVINASPFSSKLSPEKSKKKVKTEVKSKYVDEYSDESYSEKSSEEEKPKTKKIDNSKKIS